MDRHDCTILSDRGAAIQKTLASRIKKAFSKPCPKHLEGNLKSKGFCEEIYISLYWRATNAPTKAKYEKVVEEIVQTPKGLLYMYIYI